MLYTIVVDHLRSRCTGTILDPYRSFLTDGTIGQIADEKVYWIACTSVNVGYILKTVEPD